MPIRRLRRQWAPAAQLPAQLIHNDIHPGNVLRTLSGQPFYLDFGSVASGPRVFDLAYALAHLIFGVGASTRSGPESFPWDAVPELLRAYEDASGRPLSPDERRALAPYAASVPLYYDICDWGERPWRHVSHWLLAHPDAIETRPRGRDQR